MPPCVALDATILSRITISLTPDDTHSLLSGLLAEFIRVKKHPASDKYKEDSGKDPRTIGS